MNKRRGMQLIVYSEISLLILAIVSLSFILGQTNIVAAQNNPPAIKPTDTPGMSFEEQAESVYKKAYQEATQNGLGDSEADKAGQAAKEAFEGQVGFMGKYGMGGYLFQGLEYAGIVAGAIMLIGQLAGFN